MEWQEVELDGNRTAAFPERTLPRASSDQDSAKFLGGLLRGGKWGWITAQYSSEATLLICSAVTGESVSRHTFWSEELAEDQRCSIRCVEELFPGQPDRSALVAVCMELWDDAGEERPSHCPLARTQIAIYSVAFHQVLRVFDLKGMLCSTLAFLDERLCQGTHLDGFDGCLAVGTEKGLVLLMDLNCAQLLDSRSRCIRGSENEPATAEIFCFSCSDSMDQVNALLEDCRAKDVHLAVEVGVARIGIRCLVGISVAPGFLAGLEDGSILVFDLVNFHLTTTLRPPENPGIGPSTVERLCCILPPDDPKPCFYICAMYRSSERLSMLLHSVNYRRCQVDEKGERFRFEHFQASSVRNHQEFDGGNCSVIACTTVDTFSFAGDKGTQLAILSWHSNKERKNKLVLFDINQWYKDEMPPHVRPHEQPHYLAGYILSGLPTGLALQLCSNSIMHFVSLQRFDEHFYPDSLTFDCSLLTPTGCRFYAEDGVQHRFLNALRWERATLFLRPHLCHEEIVRLRLLPQFSELHPNATFSKVCKQIPYCNLTSDSPLPPPQSAMYEEILSVALEHKCLALLNDCARSWTDGSFLRNTQDPTELSLATLTNWIVRRAGQIKARCSELAQGIFDYGGYSLDERERREFQALSIQLLDLLGLQTYILEQGRRSLPPSVVSECEANERALQTVHVYQKVLYWFIEEGLLPGGQHLEHAAQREQSEQPLIRLQRAYADRRVRLQNQQFYIDELARRASMKCQYPPSSLQTLLCVMLSPDTQPAVKHSLVIYLLLDLGPGLGPGRGLELCLRFQTAFQISGQLVKSVRSFWCLDRGDYEKCVDELYDGSNPASGYEDWQTKLLVNGLLAGGAPKLALCVTSQLPGPLAPWLHLRALLANDSVPEAFHLARLYDDEGGQPLLEGFFRHCIAQGRFKVLAELCLREQEERVVYRLLRECDSRQAERVKLILLLKKSKYLDAAAFMDDVAAERQRKDEPSSSMITAFRSTMAPFSQTIAGTYFSIRTKLDQPGEDLHAKPQPFSCQLIKQNASGEVGGIFHRSALSAHWATSYGVPSWMPPAPAPAPVQPHPMAISNSAGNIPFLRHAQYGLAELPRRTNTVRPVPHQVVQKRQREEEELRQTERERRDQCSMQPAKRRQTPAEKLLDDVRGFIRDAKRKKLNLEEEDSKSSTSLRNTASELLQPPTFLQASHQVPKRPDSNSPTTFLTILKRRPALEDVAGTPPKATSTTMSGIKQFRFVAPIPLRHDGSMEVDSDPRTMEQEEGQEEEEEEGEEVEGEEEGTDEIIVEIESQSNPREASSVESEEEEEEFLSPLQSANVSLVTQSLEQTRQTQETGESLLPMGPPAGPQPRHSLLHTRSSGLGDGNRNGSESSGFGSFATVVGAAQTTSHSQFVPTICSSKMYETQSHLQIFSSGGSSNLVKISERTTICGDMESTDLVPEPTVSLTAASSQWTNPFSGQGGQSLRLMDTTLSMSTYDMTALEPREQNPEETDVELHLEGTLPEIQEQHEEQEQQDDLVQQDELMQQDDLVQQDELMQQDGLVQQVELVEEQDQEQTATDYQLTYLASSEAPAQDPPHSSPTYSLSSEESSDLSSTSYRDPMRTTMEEIENPLFTIVDSITTSRSVTHTPTSFLPSDTNVSQNSSPRAPHGAGGDGSPPLLYRANSLETVDDLDTTKGSLEEEEDDDEDDCVIALDGTEVRGYVARPSQSQACSSAELFAFKDECLEETAPGPCPSLSLAATVNSDSEVAPGTIVLDSDEEENELEKRNQALSEKVEEPASSNDSVATVAFSEHKQRFEREDADLEVIQEDQELEEDCVLLVSDEEDPEVMVQEELHLQQDQVEEKQMQEEPMEEEQVEEELTKEQQMEEEPMDEVQMEEEQMKEELMEEQKAEEQQQQKAEEQKVEESEENQQEKLQLKEQREEEKEEQRSNEEQKDQRSNEEQQDQRFNEERLDQTLAEIPEEDSENELEFERDATNPLPAVTTRNLRSRRGSSTQVDANPAVHTPPVAARRVRLRSDDTTSTPPVTTPKRRILQRMQLEVIDEQSGSSDASAMTRTTRSRSRLSIDAE
ncbi:hypothetical protein KR009_008313, partial [Drosophila setifemur]